MLPDNHMLLLVVCSPCKSVSLIQIIFPSFYLILDKLLCALSSVQQWHCPEIHNITRPSGSQTTQCLIASVLRRSQTDSVANSISHFLFPQKHTRTAITLVRSATNFVPDILHGSPDHILIASTIRLFPKPNNFPSTARGHQLSSKLYFPSINRSLSQTHITLTALTQIHITLS